MDHVSLYLSALPPSILSSPPALRLFLSSFYLPSFFASQMCTHPLFPSLSSLLFAYTSPPSFPKPSPFTFISFPLIFFPSTTFFPFIFCLYLFELERKYVICPPNTQPTPLNHINDLFSHRLCNYTAKRLLENTVVQLRGEPTTANLRMGERSSVRQWCVRPCTCVCVRARMHVCKANSVILSNLAVQIQVGKRMLKCQGAVS